VQSGQRTAMFCDALNQCILCCLVQRYEELKMHRREVSPAAFRPDHFCSARHADATRRDFRVRDCVWRLADTTRAIVEGAHSASSTLPCFVGRSASSLRALLIIVHWMLHGLRVIRFNPNRARNCIVRRRCSGAPVLALSSSFYLGLLGCSARSRWSAMRSNEQLARSCDDLQMRGAFRRECLAGAGKGLSPHVHSDQTFKTGAGKSNHQTPGAGYTASRSAARWSALFAAASGSSDLL